MPVGGLTTDELLSAGIAGALVVLCGGAYSLFLALGFMRRQARAKNCALAYTSYLLLVVSFVVLAGSLHMSANWYAIVVLLVLAYLLSPHLIWKLTKATHVESEHGDSGYG